MPRKQVTRIDPLSAAKISALLYSGLGLFVAILFAIEPRLAPQPLPREALLLLPFFNAIIGFIGGAMLAGFYNLIASTIGGIVIHVADDTPREPQ
jgi:hypothetical protein